MLTEFINKIENNDILVLATSSNKSISIRKVCYVYLNGMIYFLTSLKTQKSKDLLINENVAISMEDLQITATANSIGSPLLKKNRNIANCFLQKHKFYFDRFNKSKNAVFYEVQIKFIKAWKFENGKDIWVKEKYLTTAST